MRTRSKQALGAFACTFLASGPCAYALTTPPMQTRDYQQSSNQAVFNGQQGRFNISEWDFAQGPAPNATGNLVFDTVRSLLQHWPNTRYRNGHTIVPGVIPPGTLLYHGTGKPVVPTTPEWTATDPEHSYIFCRQSGQRNPAPAPNATATASPPPATGDDSKSCWHLTLGATRALRVLYFDGNSAARIHGGPMHSQDIVAWGRIVEDKVFAERERLGALCEWGKKWGVDGFVRMEMDFEVMLCDFTAGLEVVSFLNLPSRSLTPINIPRRRREPPTDPSYDPSHASNTYPEARTTGARLEQRTYVLEAGSWHNAYPGEGRIALDYTRIVSMYDTALFPGLAQARVGVPRLKHALDGMDERDLDAFRARLELVVAGDDHRAGQGGDPKAEGGGGGSGVDWRTLFHAIAERYSARLERLPRILNGTQAKEAQAKQRVAQAHRAVAIMLVPYLLYNAVPPSDDYNASRGAGSAGDAKKAHAWAAPVWANCAEAHTHALERPAIQKRMTAAERLLFGAAREVEREICRVLVGMWAEGRELGLDDDHNGEARLVDSEDKVSYAALAADWRVRVQELMHWLDWSVDWLKCRPACSFEEICVLPTWPYFNRPMPRFSNETIDGIMIEEEPDNDWEDPQPSCMAVMEPLGGSVEEQEF